MKNPSPELFQGGIFVPVSVLVSDSRLEIIIHSRIKMHKEMPFHGLKSTFPLVNMNKNRPREALSRFSSGASVLIGLFEKASNTNGF